MLAQPLGRCSLPTRTWAVVSERARNNSGSLATLAEIRRASSQVEKRCGPGRCAHARGLNFVQADGAKCDALGYETGSANYENCMMIHANARNFLATEDRARAAQAPTAVPQDDPGAAIQKNINGMCEANPVATEAYLRTNGRKWTNNHAMGGFLFCMRAAGAACRAFAFICKIRWPKDHPARKAR